MEKGKGKGKTSPEQLAEKYRVSWDRATEPQQQGICQRLGLTFTHAKDEILLRKIATKQQELYQQNKMTRQAEKEKEKIA